MGVSLIPKLEGPGVEPDNLPAGKITLWFGILTIIIIISIVGTWQYTIHAVSAERARKNVPNRAQLIDVQAKSKALLDGHGPVAGQPGIYRMPIKRAMRLLARKPKLINKWQKKAPPKPVPAVAPATAPTVAPKATSAASGTAATGANTKEVKPAEKPQGNK